MRRAANFDGLARVYRWLEYGTLGPALERTRTRMLPRLAGVQQALVLGDGDGRFTAALLGTYPAMQAEAVDVSRAMLAEMRRRVPSSRLRTTVADVRGFTPDGTPGLITTHFVLDCLTQAEVEAVIARLVPCLAPGGLWLVSEFRIPAGVLRWPARVYVRALYVAFRVLTGLRVTRLPEHRGAMRAAGLELVAEEFGLGGVLVSELWQRSQGLKRALD